MNNTEFINKALDVAKNYKTVYMWGTFGSPVTTALIAEKAGQYSTWYTAAKQAALTALVGKGYWAFDCVGLIKGILWGWNGDSSKTYGGASYASGGVPDVTANTMITYCKDVSTDFSKIEVGEALWTDGHIGIYVGNGLGVEASPKWENNVQVTAVGNIGNVSGYNTRAWKKHGKLPYIEYVQATTTTTANTEAEDAIEYLGAIGVINSPAYWYANYSKVQYLDQLLINASKAIKAKGTPALTVNGAISALVSAGVINSPDYWTANHSKLQYLDGLLMALGGSV